MQQSLMSSMDVVVVVLVALLSSLCSSRAVAQTNVSGSAFDCPPLERSAGTPTSVHRLRPSDIAVVGAMGNSLTAGFGVLGANITAIYNEAIDYRGLAWSAGGDASLGYVTTLPNILRQYNPELRGFSTGTTSALNEDFIDLPNTGLNVARSGAETSEMAQQARDLVRKVRESDDVDFDQDWKLITILIGFNDICDVCDSDDDDMDDASIDEAPDRWSSSVMAGLDYLRDNLPRSLVNLVQVTDLGRVLRENVQANSPLSPVCAAAQSFICSCFGPLTANGSSTFDDLVQRYRQNLESLVESGRYNQSDDFAVVLQPFQSTIELDDEADDQLSFLATDCSHFSPTGNRFAAVSLWNNMFERVGGKSDTLSLATAGRIYCPTNEQPYIATSSGTNEQPYITTSSVSASFGPPRAPSLLLVVFITWIVKMSS